MFCYISTRGEEEGWGPGGEGDLRAGEDEEALITEEGDNGLDEELGKTQAMKEWVVGWGRIMDGGRREGVGN